MTCVYTPAKNISNKAAAALAGLAGNSPASQWVSLLVFVLARCQLKCLTLPLAGPVGIPGTRDPGDSPAAILRKGDGARRKPLAKR